MHEACSVSQIVASILERPRLIPLFDVPGEDALANLSIEKQDGVLTGHIRIRSKTQGIALSLGDKVSLAQKAIQPANDV